MNIYKKIFFFICIMCCTLLISCSGKNNVPNTSMAISIDTKKVISNDSVKINNILFLLNQCNKQKAIINDRSLNGIILIEIKKDGKLYSMELYSASIVYQGMEYTGDEIKSIKSIITNIFFESNLLSQLIGSSKEVKVLAQANYNASHTFTDEEKKQFKQILLSSHNNTYDNTHITPNMTKFPYYKIILCNKNKTYQIDILNENYITLKYDNYEQQYNVSSELWGFLSKFNLGMIKDALDIRYLYYSDKLKYVNENYKDADLIDRKDYIITILCGGNKIEENKNMISNNPITLIFYVKNETKTVTIYKDYFMYNNVFYKLQGAGETIMSVLKAN